MFGIGFLHFSETDVLKLSGTWDVADEKCTWGWKAQVTITRGWTQTGTNGGYSALCPNNISEIHF